MKIQRNAPCPCGSGRKYKHCCLDKQQTRSVPVWQKLLVFGLAVLVVGVVIAAAVSFVNKPPSEAGGRVWSEEHGHWHDE